MWKKAARTAGNHWGGDDMTPRWEARFDNEAQAKHSVFRGRAGPLDIWEDTFDAFTPYAVLWGDGYPSWCIDAERIIMKAKAGGIHLTLHDECRVYQICGEPTD